MNERSEIERLGIELAKMVNGSSHGVIATTADKILALAAPEESPLPWPGDTYGPSIDHEAGYWRVHAGPKMPSGFHQVRMLFNTTTRAAAVAEWNRVVRALAPTTPEGWREVERCVVISDVDATFCSQGGVRCLLRRHAESDADMLARLNPPPGTPVIRVRRAEG